VEKKPKKQAADKKPKPKPKLKTRALRNHNVRVSVVQSENNDPMSQPLPATRGWTMGSPSPEPIIFQQPLPITLLHHDQTSASRLAEAMQRHDPFKYAASPISGIVGKPLPDEAVMETWSQPKPSTDAPSSSGVRQRIQTFEDLSPGGPWPIPESPSNKALRGVPEAIRKSAERQEKGKARM
jgi:hypothetical protein